MVSKTNLHVGFELTELAVPPLLLEGSGSSGRPKDVCWCGCQRQSRLNGGASGSALCCAEEDPLAPQQDDDGAATTTATLIKGGRMAGICFPTYRWTGASSEEVHVQRARSVCSVVGGAGESCCCCAVVSRPPSDSTINVRLARMIPAARIRDLGGRDGRPDAGWGGGRRARWSACLQDAGHGHDNRISTGRRTSCCTLASKEHQAKKAVESCVQHQIEPANHSAICASLDRRLHESRHVQRLEVWLVAPLALHPGGLTHSLTHFLTHSLTHSLSSSLSLVHLAKLGLEIAPSSIQCCTPTLPGNPGPRA